MVTIRDVAKRAGVSVSAVSRAMNNYMDINPETKEKILQVVKELRYYPNASARRLVTNRSNTIGVTYPNFEGQGLRQPFISHMLEAFKHAIGKGGYDLLLFSNEKEPFDKFSYLDRVRHRDIDGILLVGAQTEVSNELVAANVPMVGIDHSPVGERVGSVTSDNRRAIHELVTILYHNDYRRFGFAHGELNQPIAMERLQGFYGGLASVGMKPNGAWIFSNSFALDGGHSAAEQILRLSDRPDVVIFSSDIAAIGAVQVFSAHGMRIPEDIAVVGFDDVDAASYVYPKLTTIKQDKDQMGTLAAQLLVDLIENPENRMPKHFVLPTQLVIRETTRPLKLVQSVT